MTQPIDIVLARLQEPKRKKDRWRAHCPAHDDTHPSLDVTEAPDGTVLVKCQSQGCSFDNIVSSMGLQTRDFFPDRIGSRFTMEDADAALTNRGLRPETIRHFRIVANIEKQAWEFPLGKDAGTKYKTFSAEAKRRYWVSPGTKHRLYHLAPCTGKSEAWMCEGEPDVWVGHQAGLVAFTFTGGAENMLQSHHVEEIKAAKIGTIHVVYDLDNPGRQGAAKVAAAFANAGVKHTVRQLPETVGDKGDVTTLYNNLGRDDETFRRAMQTLPEIDAPPPTPSVPTQMRDDGRNAPQHEIDDDGWEIPVPLGADAVPRFPVDALPPVFQDYVSAVADFMEVPLDLPGVLTLGVTAAAIARKVRIQILGEYSEPLNTFAAIAMMSGTRKSSVFSDVTAPLVEYERELLDRTGPEIAELQSRARVREKELGHAETMAAKGGPDASKWDNARRELARLVRETEVPAEPRILMADATPEAVAQGLVEQGGRLAVFSPEGDVFALLKRYSKDGVANFETYLKAHAGDELRVDRRHAAPVTVPNPALTVAVCVQPDVLQGLAQDRVFRERGLLARFLYAVPRSVVGKRTFDGQAVPAAVRQRYMDAVAWLCEWPTQTDPLTLSPDAFQAWRSFALTVEDGRLPGGRFAQLLDWSGKLPGLVARLAGGLHAASGATAKQIGPTVEAETIGAAVRLGEYAASHALAAFGMMGTDEALANAETLLEWIRRTHQVQFSTRGSYRENRALDPKMARLGIETLVERGWIRPALDVKRNGRPSERWDVHPNLEDV